MRKILFFLILVSTVNVFSQNRKDSQQVRIVRHTVALGETVRMISKKYLVDPSEIYKLNKDAVNGVSGGMVLRIPVPIKDEPIVSIEETPEVVAEEIQASELQETKEVQVASNSEKETEVQEISTSMVVEKKTLKKPQTTPTQDLVFNGFTTHIVKRNETLYSLSRQYNISVEVIKNHNLKALKKGLQLGQSIKIPTVSESNQQTEIISEETIVEEVKPVAESENGTVVENNLEIISHKVLSGETLFGLARKYNISVEEIKNQNEGVLKRGLQVGQTLKIKKNN